MPGVGQFDDGWDSENEEWYPVQPEIEVTVPPEWNGQPWGPDDPTDPNDLSDEQIAFVDRIEYWDGIYYDPATDLWYDENLEQIDTSAPDNGGFWSGVGDFFGSLFGGGSGGGRAGSSGGGGGSFGGGSSSGGGSSGQQSAQQMQQQIAQAQQQGASAATIAEMQRQLAAVQQGGAGGIGMNTILIAGAVGVGVYLFARSRRSPD